MAHSQKNLVRVLLNICNMLLICYLRISIYFKCNIRLLHCNTHYNKQLNIHSQIITCSSCIWLKGFSTVTFFKPFFMEMFGQKAINENKVLFVTLSRHCTGVSKHLPLGIVHLLLCALLRKAQTTLNTVTLSYIITLVSNNQ